MIFYFQLSSYCVAAGFSLLGVGVVQTTSRGEPSFVPSKDSRGCMIYLCVFWVVPPPSNSAK